MRSLIALMWRENRGLVYGFLVLTPILSAAMKHGLLEPWQVRAEHSLVFFVPIMLGLFLVALGCDLVAGDAASERIAFFAALPIRPATLWAWKLSFLALVSAGFLGYVFLSEEAVLALRGRTLLGAVIVGWNVTATAFGLAVVAGAAAVFFSTLLGRGIAAAIAAVAFLAGLLGLVRALGVTVDVYSSIEPWSVRLEAATLTAALLAGSFFAFTGGRIWLSARLRRIAFAGIGFVLALVPTTAWAGYTIVEYATPEPSDDDVRIWSVAVTPDHHWAQLVAYRRGTPPLGLGRALRPPTDYRRARYRVSLEDGHCEFLEIEEPPAPTYAPRRDPPSDVLHRLPRGWRTVWPSRRWGTAVRGTTIPERPGCGVLFHDTGRLLRLPGAVWALPETPDGAALGRESGEHPRIVRMPLDGGPAETIVAGACPAYTYDRARESWFVLVAGRVYELVGTDFRPVRYDGPEIEPGRYCSLLPASGPHSSQLRCERGLWRIDPDARRVTPVTAWKPGLEVVRMDKAGTVFYSPAERAFTVANADGTVRRVEIER